MLLATWPLCAQVLNDPTRPQPAAKKMQGAEQAGNLVLSAIFISDAGKQAIINGKSIGEGQVIGAYKVVTISHNRVQLSSADGLQLLQINNNNLKKESANGF